MSVVAWDGKTVAADKIAVSAEMRTTTTKVFRLDDAILAWVGESGGGIALLDWYKNGSVQARWPAAQNTDNWTRLIVARASGVFFFEREPHAQKVEEPFMAWGSGRDYAMGAMAMGASAEEAVEVAIRFSTTCGNGIDSYEIPS